MNGLSRSLDGFWVGNSQKQVLKDWNDTGDFSGFDMTQNEACKLHRDWQFLLQEQDATALLQYACDHYSYAIPAYF